MDPKSSNENASNCFKLNVELFDPSPSSKRPQNLIEFKVEFINVFSVVKGKVALPRLIALRFIKSGSLVLRVIHLNPFEYKPENLESDLLVRSLVFHGYNAAGTEVKLWDDGYVVEKSQFINVALDRVMDILKELREELGENLIVSYRDMNSMNFFHCQLQVWAFAMHRHLFLDCVDEIECAQSRELLSEGLVFEAKAKDWQDFKHAQLSSHTRSAVFVQANFLTLKQGEKSYTQLTNVGLVSLNELAYSASILPMVNTARGISVKESSWFWVMSVLKLWSHPNIKVTTFVNEREALLGLCLALQKACSCSSTSKCELVIVSCSTDSLEHLLLAKIREHKLEREFFTHITHHLDFKTLSKGLDLKSCENMYKYLQNEKLKLPSDAMDCASLCAAFSSSLHNADHIRKLGRFAKPIGTFRVDPKNLQSQNLNVVKQFSGEFVECEIVQGSGIRKLGKLDLGQ